MIAWYQLTPWLCLTVRQQVIAWPKTLSHPLRVWRSSMMHANAPCWCSDAKVGVPPVLQHFLTNIQALHDVVVLIHVRHVPVSSVLPEERLLIQPLTGFAGCAAAVVLQALYSLNLITAHPPSHICASRLPADSALLGNSGLQAS